MVRLATLAAFIGAVAGLLVFTGRGPLVRIFTSDPEVISQVGAPSTQEIGGGAAAWTTGRAADGPTVMGIMEKGTDTVIC